MSMKKSGKIISVILSTFLVGCLIVMSIGSMALAMVMAPEAVGLPAAPPGQANFSASNLLISPQQVFPNQEVEISINIANHGDEKGSHSVALYINGVVEGSETVGVSPGATKLVVFKVRRAIPGQYLVSVEGQQGQFTVISESAPPSTSTTTPAPAAGGGLGTAGIIVIVVVVVALVLGLYFGVRRRV